MSDLISRQAAIDAVKRLSLGETDAVRLAMRIGYYLERLQSAQPTFDARDTQYNLPIGTDLISRQAAIDALYHVDEYNGRSVEAIRNLPSAQPERTCVNCGRTANNGGWYADGRTRCPIEEHYALPKDGFCHLWEKRNITDDDYPERREE